MSAILKNKIFFLKLYCCFFFFTSQNVSAQTGYGRTRMLESRGFNIDAFDISEICIIDSLWYEKKTNKQLSGIVKECNNDTLYREWSLENGVLNGCSIEYHDKVAAFSSVMYKNGLKHGLSFSLEYGLLSSEEVYKEGKLIKTGKELLLDIVELSRTIEIPDLKVELQEDAYGFISFAVYDEKTFLFSIEEPDITSEESILFSMVEPSLNSLVPTLLICSFNEFQKRYKCYIYPLVKHQNGLKEAVPPFSMDEFGERNTKGFVYKINETDSVTTFSQYDYISEATNYRLILDLNNFLAQQNNMIQKVDIISFLENDYFLVNRDFWDDALNLYGIREIESTFCEEFSHALTTGAGGDYMVREFGLYHLIYTRRFEELNKAYYTLDAIISGLKLEDNKLQQQDECNITFTGLKLCDDSGILSYLKSLIKSGTLIEFYSSDDHIMYIIDNSQPQRIIYTTDEKVEHQYCVDGYSIIFDKKTGNILQYCYTDSLNNITEKLRLNIGLHKRAPIYSANDSLIKLSQSNFATLDFNFDLKSQLTTLDYDTKMLEMPIGEKFLYILFERPYNGFRDDYSCLGIAEIFVGYKRISSLAKNYDDFIHDGYAEYFRLTNSSVTEISANELSAKGEYLNGKKIGEWIYFYQHQMYERRWYDGGVPSRYEYYDYLGLREKGHFLKENRIVDVSVSRFGLSR